MPVEQLFECMPSNDIRDTKKFVNDLVTQKGLARKFITARATRALKYFKRAPAVAKKRLAKYKPNVLDESQSANEFLAKYKPPETIIQPDPYNGRWRIIAPEFHEWKSVSWSKRGWEKAVMLTLYTAWKFEERYTGVASPYKMEDLRKAFSDDPEASSSSEDEP